MNIASELGATVIATTRRAEHAGLLRSLGADQVVIDAGPIAAAVRELIPGGVDRVLDLVGNSVLRDSLAAASVHARVCQAGFLGGLGPVDQFLPIVDLPTAVQLSFFGSFELGTETFPYPAFRCRPSSPRSRRATTGPGLRACLPSRRSPMRTG